MKASSLVALSVLASLVLAAGCGAGVRTPHPAFGVRVTADSVGPLPLAAPLAELRRRWPGARSTLYYEHEAVFPAVLFRVGPVHALAVQARMDEVRFRPLPLRSDCPADFWRVSGTGVLLPGGAGPDARWADLRRLYGPAEVSTEVHLVRVHFESLPGWSFELEDDDTNLVALLDQGGEAAIPADTRIQYVFVRDAPAAQDSCAGRPD